MIELQIHEPAMLIRIARLYDPGMSDVELYEATRGHWRAGPRRERADLALAVAGGIVREVFEIDGWHPAGTTPNATSIHGAAPPDRWEFVGRLAAEAVRTKYVGGSVKSYFTPGNQNPIRYVNC
jgi:hypothetical protein